MGVFVEANYWGESRETLRCLSGGAETDGSCFTNPVSITQLSQNRLIVANYHKLFEVDLDTRRVQAMRHNAPGKWNPTGVFYSDVLSRLFVANYTGDNVLVFAVSDGQLTYLDEIATNRSPEVVHVSDDGRFLAVSNYDDGTVQLFSLEDKKQIWRVPIGNAHGVLIWDGIVYATDLVERQLVELDLATGRCLRRIGRLGLARDEFEVLWPTSVTRFGDDVMVTDGQRGSIFILDRASLKPKVIFGQNGPSEKHLLMPYSAASLGNNRIVVGCVFQDRLLVVNVADQRINVERSIGSYHAWDYLRESPLEPLFTGTLTGWEWPVHVDAPSIQVQGRTYRTGFKALREIETNSLLPITASAGLLADEFYFTTSLQAGDTLLLTNPCDTVAHYIAHRAGTYYCLPIALPKGTWAIGSEIYGPQGKIRLEDVSTDMEPALASLSAERSANGRLPPSALRWLYLHPRSIRESTYSPTPSELLTHLEAHFRTSHGKAFLGTYTNLTESSTMDEVRGSAALYWASDMSSSEHRFDERILVSMLTGETWN